MEIESDTHQEPYNTTSFNSPHPTLQCDYSYSGLEFSGPIPVSCDANNYSELEAEPLSEQYNTMNFDKNPKELHVNSSYTPDSYSALEFSEAYYNSVDYSKKKKGQQKEVQPPDCNSYSHIECKQSVQQARKASK